MKLRKLFSHILLQSGQFLTEDDVELDLDKFKLLVEFTLGTYNKFSPFHKKFNVDVSSVSSNLGGIKYTFTETQSTASNPTIPDFDDGIFTPNKNPNLIPDWISDIVPVRLAGVHPWYFQQNQDGNFNYLETKKQFPWEYIKPNLFVPIASIYEVTAVYKHRLTAVSSQDFPNGPIKLDYELKTISENDDNFMNLLTARFMKALGRNRRAFTLNELPITMDSGELVSEGNDLEQTTLQNLENNQKFYLSYR